MMPYRLKSNSVTAKKYAGAFREIVKNCRPSVCARQSAHIDFDTAHRLATAIFAERDTFTKIAVPNSDEYFAYEHSSRLTNSPPEQLEEALWFNSVCPERIAWYSGDGEYISLECNQGEQALELFVEQAKQSSPTMCRYVQWGLRNSKKNKALMWGDLSVEMYGQPDMIFAQLFGRGATLLERLRASTLDACFATSESEIPLHESHFEKLTEIVASGRPWAFDLLEPGNEDGFLCTVESEPVDSLTAYVRVNTSSLDLCGTHPVVAGILQMIDSKFSIFGATAMN